MGGYVVPERAAKSAPAHGLDGEALTEFWVELVDACIGPAQRREAAAALLGDPAQHTEVVGWRYAQKLTIKAREAIAALLHGILAPDAPFVCDHGCPHVRAGATRKQVKRFLDSLDAAAEENSRRALEAAGTSLCEELLDERGDYQIWRERLAKRAGAPQPG
jgi:hypothetical protein